MVVDFDAHIRAWPGSDIANREGCWESCGVYSPNGNACCKENNTYTCGFFWNFMHL